MAKPALCGDAMSLPMAHRPLKVVMEKWVDVRSKKAHWGLERGNVWLHWGRSWWQRKLVLDFV